MPRRAAHDFRVDRECQLACHARSYLTLVDVDSYPTSVSPQADRFDLLQHLCAQTQALTAMMWEVPEGRLHLQLLWTPDGTLGERLYRQGHRPIADGPIRTSGRLALLNDEQLLAAARKSATAPRSPSPAHLLVPPGVYAVSILNGLISSSPQEKDSALGYTVLLRHHPHPAPRRNPIRLDGHFGGPEEGFAQQDVITSHARIY